MIKNIKVMLYPNDKQRTKLFKSADVARFAYNWALNYQIENYKNDGTFISQYELRRIFTQFKTQDEYLWLKDYSNNIAKQAIKDCCGAYQKFFKGLAKYPKFKSKRRSKPSFYVDTAKIKFKDGKVKLEKLSLSNRPNKRIFNWIRLAEPNRIPENVKYFNPRVTFDGLNWWITVGVEYNKIAIETTNSGIGIDLGVKDLAVCSDGNTYRNINKTHRVRKLNKKKRRLQRKVSRKYLMNKKGESYQKTSNIVRSQKQLLKLNHRLTNIHHNYLHQTTTEIVNRKPKFIVLEDLNVQGMMKNRHLAKAIKEQCFCTFRKILEYKCNSNHIELRFANRFYPSSKMCSNCGSIKKDLKLKDRIYHCDVCGNVIDRDFQASVNLKNCTDYRVA